MDWSDVVWGGILAVAALVETVALLNKRQGDTLSERTRAWLRVYTRPGRALFAVGWVGFAVWFFFHIL